MSFHFRQVLAIAHSLSPLGSMASEKITQLIINQPRENLLQNPEVGYRSKRSKSASGKGHTLPRARTCHPSSQIKNQLEALQRDWWAFGKDLPTRSLPCWLSEHIRWACSESGYGWGNAWLKFSAAKKSRSIRSSAIARGHTQVMLPANFTCCYPLQPPLPHLGTFWACHNLL